MLAAALLTAADDDDVGDLPDSCILNKRPAVFLPLLVARVCSAVAVAVVAAASTRFLRAVCSCRAVVTTAARNASLLRSLADGASSGTRAAIAPSKCVSTDCLTTDASRCASLRHATTVSGDNSGNTRRSTSAAASRTSNEPVSTNSHSVVTDNAVAKWRCGAMRPRKKATLHSNVPPRPGERASR